MKAEDIILSQSKLSDIFVNGSGRFNCNIVVLDREHPRYPHSPNLRWPSLSGNKLSCWVRDYSGRGDKCIMFHWTNKPCKTFGSFTIFEGQGYRIKNATAQKFMGSNVSKFQMKLDRFSSIERFEPP